MRIFWLIVGIVIVLAAAVVLVPVMRNSRAASETQIAAKQEQLAREQTLLAQAQARAEDAAIASTGAAGRIATTPVPGGAAPAAAPVAVDTAATKSAVSGEHAGTPVVAAKVEETVKTPVVAHDTTDLKADVKSTDAAADAELLQIVGADGAAPAPASKPEVSLIKEMPKLEALPNGGQKVDDKFIIKGTGVKTDPYVVSWDHLVSIQETFDPSQKKDKIPARLSFLDGSYVKITGYICFPLYVPQPKELLVMMNQWDGCCIGVPPTAYDAIEVQLRSKVGEDERYAVHGSVKGKFAVKPYVTGNWLVGLYLMTDAEFEPSQNNGE